jgi:predicted RNA binding protein YcfA (HicA-like mRNA interferase family)
MSEKLPALKSAEIIKIVEKKGFVKVRQSGSHAIYKHIDGRRTTIPVHSGKTIGKGLLKQIIKDTDISVDELRSR